MKFRNFLYLILMLVVQNSFAQSQEDVAYIKKLPAFTMYGDNYFITGTALKNGFTSRTSDVKFQIGFKQRLKNVAFPLGIFPFLSYKQKSFWNVFEESAPFRETNYNPAIGLVKLFVKNKKITNVVWLSFEHESNGRNEEYSRSWNFFSLTYLKPFGKKWQFLAKVWVPVGDLSDNTDIVSYRGYGFLGANYKAFENIFMDIHLQPAFKNKLTGFVRATASFRVSKSRNQFIYIQYFGGYSEDLINYNKSCNNIRVGIVLKDLFANFETSKIK